MLNIVGRNKDLKQETLVVVTLAFQAFSVETLKCLQKQTPHIMHMSITLHFPVN